MSRVLPANPSIRFLKEQAKDLLKAHKRGEPSCCPTLRLLRRFAKAPDSQILSQNLGLHEVQFALAMDYGFRSWKDLTHEVALHDHVLKHIRYWERFGPAEGFETSTEDGKARRVLADAEWRRLAESELHLQPLPSTCQEIRRQIARMERCHQHYMQNVEWIIDMIGTDKPRPILDCGQADEQRRTDAAAWATALQNWLTGGSVAPDVGRYQEACALLGEPSPQKRRLVQHLVAKLWDNGYKVQGSDDFSTVESRIEHLSICNFNWDRNIRIVLREIAVGRQLVGWHSAYGFCAHGDFPGDRVELLKPLVAGMSAWIDGRTRDAGSVGQRLGRPDAGKCWLVGCLRKSMIAIHTQREDDRASTGL